jgi:hypothetical protein
VSYRSEVFTLRRENEELQRRVAELEEARGRVVPEVRPSGARAALQRLSGGAGELQVTLEVPTELSPDGAARVVERLERRVGSSAAGATGLYVGSRLSWSSSRSFEQTSNVDVVVSAIGEGRSMVRVRERPARFGVAVYGLFAFWLLPVGGLLAMLVAELLRTGEPHPNLISAIFMTAAVCVLSTVASRRGLRAWTDRRRRRVEAWAGDVAQEIGVASRARLASGRARIARDCLQEASASLEHDDPVRVLRRG